MRKYVPFRMMALMASLCLLAAAMTLAEAASSAAADAAPRAQASPVAPSGAHQLGAVANPNPGRSLFTSSSSSANSLGLIVGGAGGTLSGAPSGADGGSGAPDIPIDPVLVGGGGGGLAGVGGTGLAIGGGGGTPSPPLSPSQPLPNITIALVNSSCSILLNLTEIECRDPSYYDIPYRIVGTLFQGLILIVGK